MRIVFFGSSSIGFPLLDALLDSGDAEVVAVVTQPDRPVGRKLEITPCPLKQFALERGLKVFSPEKIGDTESLNELQTLDVDLFVVVAYGQYISSSVLSLPPEGAVNFHPSLLPKYRGASPIQWAVANGDSTTGVTILYVSKKMDAGDIILQEEVKIGSCDTAETLEPVLAEKGAELLLKAVTLIKTGQVQARPQDETKASEVRKLVKEDGRLDWTMPAEMLNNRIRAFVVWPGCFCEVSVNGETKRLKVLSSRVETASGKPGEILDLSGDGPLIAAGRDALRLTRVQPAGKKPMDGAAYLRGHPLTCRDLLM